MDFIRRNINKQNRNGTVYIGSTSINNISGNAGSVTNVTGFLPATTDDDITYNVPHYVNFQETDEDGNIKNILEITKEGIKINGNVVASGEISAYGAGESSSSGGGSVTIVDNLTSTATDVALSANQGRVLRDLIDNIDIPDVDLSDYYTKTQVDNLLDTIDLSGYYKKTEIDNLLTGYTSITSFNSHIEDTIKHITSTERTNWNSAYTNLNDWFYKDSSGNIHSKYNFIGDSEISAYGAGSSSGSATIYDGLDSTSTDVALSANQGRNLKSMIDNIDLSDYYTKDQVDELVGTGGSADLTNYYTKTQVDDLLDDIDTSWSNISGKPTFATVATSGSYNDLSNKPTIPTNNNQLTNGAGYITGITKSMVTTALGYTPPTTNTTYSAGTGLSLSSGTFSVKYGTSSGTACQGNDSRLSDSRPASDVYSWAKASSKPSYSWSEITSKPTIPTNNNQLTNGAGYITSSGSITGNAATATKLATSRTIWGQSFNGSANVSGAMTGVTTITASGAISCGSLTASGEVTAHSDRRLKDNIKPLEVRGELNPVTYVKDGKESIGFIADEVKEVYPELVVTDESTDEKYLSLNYAQLTAVLYAEIKELKNQIRELNEKVRTMAN